MGEANCLPINRRDLRSFAAWPLCASPSRSGVTGVQVASSGCRPALIGCKTLGLPATTGKAIRRQPALASGEQIRERLVVGRENVDTMLYSRGGNPFRGATNSPQKGHRSGRLRIFSARPVDSLRGGR